MLAAKAVAKPIDQPAQRPAAKPQSWFRRLGCLFIAILFWNDIQVMQGFWWTETYQIVYGTLIVTALVEIALPGKRTYRILLEAAAVLALNIVISPFQWNWAENGTLRERISGFWHDLTALHPFIEISAGIWLLFLLFAGWASTRLRIIGVTAVCLMTLAVTDSFTPIYLWDNVAWSVFAGLAWLVAEHYSRFQREHPRSWRELFRYPAQFILPIVLVLSLVMSSGLFVPEIGPVFRDPYTIWKESRGETVRSFVGDKGVGAAAESAFSAQSGYSRDDTELGGGFQFDYSPVMTVESSARSYWRGETKAEYTGSGWEDNDAERSESKIVGPSTSSRLPLSENRSKAKTAIVQQTITMKGDDRYPVLFGAGPITSILAMTSGNSERSVLDALAWGPESGELRMPAGRAMNYPETYTIVSEVTELDEGGLRSTHTGGVSAAYLQLPATVPQRVKDLADQITQDMSNDYDKAKAIEAYLRTNYSYTNTPDLKRKNSSDFVDSFLFEIKEGYCDYFSSAMAVLARAEGIPARWVKGYAPGVSGLNPSDLSDTAPLRNEAAVSTLYSVRNADAHSWVEIYFDGYGWIPFEATAGFSFPYTIAADETGAATPQNEQEPEQNQENEKASAPQENAAFTIPSYVPVLALSLLAVTVLTLAILRRKAIADAWTRYRVRTFTADERIVWETEKLVRKARRRGLSKAEHETLREAMVRWSGQRDSLQSDLSRLLTVFEKAKYSGVQTTPEEAQRYSEQVKTVIEKL
ncbi:transglutaminase TgpA family protein [Paenibacillus beijingensis]|uniref:Transglutaminase-like domain-containing protein n=1 Tax=Paenibacillus beijingensis TaxID=1126833 RepID=A0A0D5NMN6_9BACL|nr:transglutaminase domain-containing protein [Paenibacillus beijingensis]AJY76247.1 hypothetical protein VN24_18880 [Paenibacillus beijingensis]